MRNWPPTEDYLRELFADTRNMAPAWSRDDIRAQGYVDLEAEKDDLRARADHLDAILLGRHAAAEAATAATEGAEMVNVRPLRPVKSEKAG